MKKLLSALVIGGILLACTHATAVPFYSKRIQGKSLYYYIKAQKSSAWMSDLKRAR